MAENMDCAKYLRRKLQQKPLPKLSPRQPIKYVNLTLNILVINKIDFLFRPLIETKCNEKEETYVRFPLMDQQIVGDSQYKMYTIYKCRPVQFKNHLVFS